MNWKEMKDFCDGLTEDQLQKKVILWREEEAVSDIEPMKLEEDYYVDDEADGCEMESDVLEKIKENPEDYPEGLEHFRKAYSKGDPILHENF